MIEGMLTGIGLSSTNDTDGVEVKMRPALVMLIVEARASKSEDDASDTGRAETGSGVIGKAVTGMVEVVGVGVIVSKGLANMVL